MFKKIRILSCRSKRWLVTNKKAESFIDSGVKILIAVVIGALLLCRLVLPCLVIPFFRLSQPKSLTFLTTPVKKVFLCRKEFLILKNKTSFEPN